MQKLRRPLILLLALVLALGSALPAAAYDADKAQTEAERLNTLGLFLGSDLGFELDRSLNRAEAVVMLLRMTGKELDARVDGGEHPFTDVPEWADSYIGYAYEHGLAKGVSDTLFDAAAPAGAQAYVTLMLRALGYDADKAWSDWETLGKEAGLLKSGIDLENFLRGDAVLVSAAALDAKLADGSMSLCDSLIESGAVSGFAVAWADIASGAEVSKDSSLLRILAYVYSGVSEYLTPSSLNATQITKDNMAYYLGVDNLDIVDGYACEPLMMAQAHSVCLVQLADGEDVEAAKKAIAENVNPRKWICVGVEPENVLVGNIGNLVLLVMDNDHAAGIMANFEKLPGSIDGISVVQGTAVETRSYDGKSVERFAEKLAELREKYFAGAEPVCAVIPDKSWYVREGFSGSLDHERMMSDLAGSLDSSTELVDLGVLLDAESYLLTDPHWRQDSLEPVVAALGGALGFEVDWDEFEAQSVEGFLGSYSRTIDGLKPETLVYLTSRYTESASVSIYGEDEPSAVYILEKLAGSDPYSMFLSGLSPITVVNSPEAQAGRRLIVFTDSFGASIAPLLLEAYSEVTLIVLRFAPSSVLGDYVDFAGADVLYLYSAEIVNTSSVLK